LVWLVNEEVVEEVDFGEWDLEGGEWKLGFIGSH